MLSNIWSSSLFAGLCLTSCSWFQHLEYRTIQFPCSPQRGAHHKDPGCFQTPMTVTMELLGEPKEQYYFLFRRCANDHRDGHKCLFISVPNLGFFEADTSEVTTSSACTLPWQGGRDQRCLCLVVRSSQGLSSLSRADYRCPSVVASAWAPPSSLPPRQLPALLAQHTEEGQRAALALQALPWLPVH